MSRAIGERVVVSWMVWASRYLRDGATLRLDRGSSRGICPLASPRRCGARKQRRSWPDCMPHGPAELSLEKADLGEDSGMDGAPSQGTIPRRRQGPACPNSASISRWISLWISLAPVPLGCDRPVALNSKTRRLPLRPQHSDVGKIRRYVSRETCNDLLVPYRLAAGWTQYSHPFRLIGHLEAASWRHTSSAGSISTISNACASR